MNIKLAEENVAIEEKVSLVFFYSKIGYNIYRR